MEDTLWWKTTLDWRQPLIKDDHWWKITFEWRQHFMEDGLWLKTTFDRRQYLMKDTFDRIRPLIEEDLWWETTFDGRQPLTEDSLWWKMTFNERRSSMADELQCNLWRESTELFAVHLIFISWQNKHGCIVWFLYLFKVKKKTRSVFQLIMVAKWSKANHVVVHTFFFILFIIIGNTD